MRETKIRPVQTIGGRNVNQAIIPKHIPKIAVLIVRKPFIDPTGAPFPIS